MNRTPPKPFLALLMSSFFMQAPLLFAASKKGQITVIVHGLKTDQGEIAATLENEAEYLKKKSVSHSISQEILNEKLVKIVFKNVDFGEYAISMFHDENSNQKLDTNLFGIPSEPYGFSNNARAVFGPPKFRDAMVTLNENERIIEIQVKSHL